MKVKYGVIGHSQGNGHPFSWSIACNGYSKRNVSKIPFKRIVDYLSKYEINLCKNEFAEVTHVWTQDKNYSKLLAEVCNIKTICKTINELASSVDAILFLRDDIETREKYLEKIINFGKPIFVDKGLHFNPNKVSQFLRKQKYKGQIFSESPLINNKKIKLNKTELYNLGELKLINSIVNGPWNQYAIHIIEPVLKFFINKKIKNIKSFKSKDITTITIECSNNFIAIFSSVKNSNFIPYTEIIGSKSNMQIKWDFDYAFDDQIMTLKKFTHIVRNKKFIVRDDYYKLLAKIINAGN
jgi:hypothetical protein